MGEALVANESRELFRVGPASYTVRDVLDAAYLRGEIQPAWEELLRALACEDAATAAGREADEDAVDAAAQTFRYDHDLITAEETERWLAVRGLTLEDFGAFFERRYWAAAEDAPADASALPYLSAPQELRELFISELMLSGELARMAERLSWRIAVVAESGTSDGDADQLLGAVGSGHQDRSALTTALGRDDDWLKQMLQAEATYASQREKLLTPQACQRELQSVRLQLTVFDLEIIEFDSHDAACEALFCVRDDGMSMEEVATEGRYPYRREQTLLEDIAPDVQQQFLSVSAGELLEPIELAGAFRLCRIVGKSDPNPDDPAVRRRIEQRLADRYFADLAGKHIQWQVALT